MPRLAQYLGRWISALGLVSGPQGAAVRPAQGEVGGRFRARERAQSRGAWATWKRTCCTSPAIRSPSTCKTMDRYTTLAAQELAARKTPVPLWQPDPRPGVDFRQDLLPAARISGRPGRADHRLHGGALHVSEIRQGEKHELMRILHLDAGREMRGGQWQVLRLMEGLAAAGVESTLLARAGAPLYDAARKQGWHVRAARPPRAIGCLRGHDLVHAHDARSHTLAAILRGRAAGGVAARGVSGRARAGSTAARGATWRCRSS